jgi:hypothetical protein
MRSQKFAHLRAISAPIRMVLQGQRPETRADDLLYPTGAG